MTLSFRALLILLLATLTGPLRAQEQVVVVELFTSQSCSSCPPADALLREMAGLDGVIPLALHVDYWDYIGWVDSFASPAFTARQERYAQANGERTVYTPQFRIGGTDTVVGADGMAVMTHVRTHAGLTPTVRLSVLPDGDQLDIQAERISGAEPLMVQVVSYTPEAAVEILGGENNGLSAVYSHIVTDWVLAGRWEGADALSLRVARPAAGPVVVILQADGPGLIRAAVRLD
jgi:hypothetical protein